MRLKFLFLSFVFLLALHPVAAEAQSGACGVDVKWRLDGNTLVISGDGDMYDYNSSANFSYAVFSDQIEKVVFNDGVTSVGNWAFTGFANLKTVDLSSSVISIGESSFKNSGLESVVFPESLAEIKKESFQNTAISKIDIPSKVNNVGDYAFADNKFLKIIYWDADIPFEDCCVKITSTLSFYNSRYGIFSNDPVETITFGLNAKNLYSGLMSGVVDGYEIKSSGAVEYIGRDAFVGSKWLEENNMEEILYFDKCMYSYGKGLNSPKHIVIKEGTIGLADLAFYQNKYLIGITIPESMKKVGAAPFKDCISLSKVVWNAIDCHCMNLHPNYYFNESLSEISFGNKVNAIPAYLCYGCKGLTSLTFPENLKTIGNRAFQDCTGLETIVFNEHLDSIAEYAFYGCENLDAVHLTARVIGNSVFASSKNVTEITISENVKKIDYGNFYGASIKELILPASLEDVNRLLITIDNLTIKCPDAANVLNNAFRAGDIAGTHTKIGNMVFADGVLSCQNFEVTDTVVIPESVQRICGGKASALIFKAVDAVDFDFSGPIICDYVEIAEGVQRIPNNLFSHCNFTKVIIPSTVVEIGNAAFYYCENLMKIDLPMSVKKIGDAAFSGCKKLTEVEFPLSVEEIGNSAYSNCDGLTNIVFSPSITKIGDYAFRYCQNLIKVTAPWNDPTEVSVEQRTFSDINWDAVLFVPKGRIDAYKNKIPWGGFTYIKEIDGSSSEIESVEAPTISYEDGVLRFHSSTPDVMYHYTISDPDIVTGWKTGDEVSLDAYYDITAYASAPGFVNSDNVSVRLYFIDANLEGSGLLDVPAKRGVLVSTYGNTLTVSGLGIGEEIDVYDLSGRLVGHGKSLDGAATITIDTDQNILIIHTATSSIKVKR